ncbi:MAG: DegV family protein [Anaerolineales bacterium]|nr:DegV family protein [Anaerolineales bacterium]
MIKIVTDAAVRFTSPNYAQKHGVTVAPTSVHCGDVHISDGPEADLRDLRSTLKGCEQEIRIESPSVDQIAEIYSRLSAQTNQILSIHTSSGLTDTFRHAKKASQQFLGRMDIHVVDSETTSIGLGMLVQSSIQGMQRGESLDRLVKTVRGMITRLYTVMFLDDLSYLARVQLVSQSQAILGNMLGIIPFLTIEDGELRPMEKVRSRQQALEKLIEFVCEFSGLDHLGILHSYGKPTQDALYIAERLRSIYPSAPISQVSYGPTLAAFIGFNSLGAIVLESKEKSI